VREEQNRTEQKERKEEGNPGKKIEMKWSDVK